MPYLLLISAFVFWGKSLCCSVKLKERKKLRQQNMVSKNEVKKITGLYF